MASSAQVFTYKYKLAPATSLILQRGDITKFSGGAIVNAANERCLGGGGVDGAIHRAAGPELRAVCEDLPEVRPGVRCPTGEARTTPGNFHSLQVQYVIHTVGPIYQSEAVSAPLLAGAYRNSLRLANEKGLATLAFPAISCGVYGYPLHSAAQVAIQALKAEQEADSKATVNEVYFYLFGQPELDAWKAAAEELLAEHDQQPGNTGNDKAAAEGEQDEEGLSGTNDSKTKEEL